MPGSGARWASLVTATLTPAPVLDVETAPRDLTWTRQVAFITPSEDGSHDLPQLRGAVQPRLNGMGLVLPSDFRSANSTF